MKVLRWGLLMMMLFLMPVKSEALTDQENLQHFISGGQAYRQGAYQEAIAEYEAIEQNGWVSGPLYYNLANSYFKQGEIAKALLNYERAKRLMPRDSDVRANADYVRSKVVKNFKLKKANFFQKIKAMVVNFCTQNELTLIGAGSFIFLMAVWMGALYGQWSFKWRWGSRIILGFVVCATWGLLFVQLYDQQGRAVVMNPMEAQFEPKEGGTSHFALVEGQLVRVMREKDGWIKISRLDGKSGWVPKEVIEKI